MSLGLLVALVVVGVGLVIGVVAFSGLSRPARIDDEDAIRRRLAQDFPAAVLHDGLVTTDRGTAFFRCSDGRVAVARALGSRFVTRLVDPGSVRKFETSDENVATLDVGDFTLPRMRLGFASPQELRRLSDWLEKKSHA